jgi:hypothetical protein
MTWLRRQQFKQLGREQSDHDREQGQDLHVTAQFSRQWRCSPSGTVNPVHLAYREERTAPRPAVVDVQRGFASVAVIGLYGVVSYDVARRRGELYDLDTNNLATRLLAAGTLMAVGASAAAIPARRAAGIDPLPALRQPMNGRRAPGSAPVRAVVRTIRASSPKCPPRITHNASPSKLVRSSSAV